MIKNPIQPVTNKLQYRAIGIVKGIYKPENLDQINRGTLQDNQGNILDTVVLGKTLSLIKKYINLQKNYFWIVYPRNKSVTNLHLQIAGVWDPHTLDKISKDHSKKDPDTILDELNLSDNYFSIRGELVYTNAQKKELIIKISASPISKKSKSNTFKIIVEGEISLQFLNNFVSLDVVRDKKTLRLIKYEVIDKISQKN